MDKADRCLEYHGSVMITLNAWLPIWRAAGKGVGQIKSVLLSPLSKRLMSAADRGISGRVLSFTVTERHLDKNYGKCLSCGIMGIG